ncbi:MAG: hypothetical protein A2X86_19760 [Bdellovibrionales bacterium GWA2_49_15]|nr:MAG: hypothetical protein A2X86_19760 [Bdellovibrionales bacterium GWA2_49_15]HAZ12496.1 hypothetical protein [Bdellovibrionales bacterium]
MKNLLCLLLVLAVTACAFKSNNDGDGGAGGGGKTTSLSVGFDSNGDIDGDHVTNGEEIALGRNPHVAELPELSVSFLQNYKIEAKDGDKSFILDTKVVQNDPNFRYRVGSLVMRDSALSVAAKVGKFSSHTTGEITPYDLAWVKYPEIDQAFFQDKALYFFKAFGDDSLPTVKLTLENSIRLMPSAYFKSIKNVVLNFYYYDYESENYQLLKSQTIEKNFFPGMNESITVEIDNVPASLLRDNYFKKGEFIFSEVADFEIPEMGVSYKTLLANIKAKSLPVAIITPKETRVLHVGVGPGKTFAEIMTAIFDKNYQMENNEVKKLGEFENNLGDFTYLKEVRDKDKQGKWFILTSPFTGHYSDHHYTANDHLVLTYATGKELAYQTNEKLHGLWDKVTGGDDYNIYPLGNISPNSSVHLELYPGRKVGEYIVSEDRDYHERPASCGQNRLCGILEMDCMVKVNFFVPFDEELKLNKDLTGEIIRLKLIINGHEFALLDLIEKKSISLTWNDPGHLHIEISDPTKIMELQEAEENVLSLKVETFVGRDFQGAKLYEAGGQHRLSCPSVLASASMNWRIPVSESSILMEQFNQFRVRGLITLPDKTYYQRFDFALSSLISNFHN